MDAQEVVLEVEFGAVMVGKVEVGIGQWEVVAHHQPEEV